MKAQCISDWAADPKIPGGGVAVYQELLKAADLQIGIGGSDMARTALPRMRFKVPQTVRLYERRERIMAHYMAAPIDWKTPLRMGRDAMRILERRGLDESTAINTRRIKSFSREKDVPMPSPDAGT